MFRKFILLFMFISKIEAQTYSLVSNGKCTDVSGRKYILNKEDCNVGATSLNLSDNTSTTENANIFYPSGCYLWTGEYEDGTSGSGLWLNPETDNFPDCSTRDQCVCTILTACTKTDGSIPNDTPCICGNMDCTSDTGLYCDIDNNQCSDTSRCTVTDGSTANSGPCQCGTSKCTTNTGLYCDIDNNQCSGVCPVTDDSVANSGPCQCGTVRCTSGTGFHCYESENFCFTNSREDWRNASVLKDAYNHLTTC